MPPRTHPHSDLPAAPAAPAVPAAPAARTAGPASAGARGGRTRAALVRAAGELFAARGYTETRISDIAAAAGVGTASFYAHFPSKQQAFTEVMGAAPQAAGDLAAGVEPDGPSTPRGRRTRAALLAAARVVFTADGFLAARVADITAQAGVASGTFYSYFDSKEHIFREVINAATAELFERTRVSVVAATDDPVERIRAANRLYVRSYVWYGPMLRLLDQAASFDETFAVTRREIRRAFVERAAAGIRRLQEQGLADQDLDAGTAGSALAAMVGHFVHVWLDLGEPYEEELAVETLTRLWAQGIGLRLEPTR